MDANVPQDFSGDNGGHLAVGEVALVWVQACIANREQCSTRRCNGAGRCIDYVPYRLADTCITEPLYVNCRCDRGFTGPECATKISLKL